jgi:hypothetical protein
MCNMTGLLFQVFQYLQTRGERLRPPHSLETAGFVDRIVIGIDLRATLRR